MSKRKTPHSSIKFNMNGIRINNKNICFSCVQFKRRLFIKINFFVSNTSKDLIKNKIYFDE